jgi:hypothetical protein
MTSVRSLLAMSRLAATDDGEEVSGGAGELLGQHG